MAIFGVAAIIAAVLAIGAAIVMFIFVMPKKKDGKLPKILQIFHDIAHFKQFFLGYALKAMYIIATVFCIIYGFILLFGVETHSSSFYGYGYTTTTSTFGTGILIMILGPIAVRLTYELAIMFITLVQNVADINNKLKNQNEKPAETKTEAPKAQPTAQPTFNYTQQEPANPNNQQF
ncbi:MAG: hypothetical protein E7532_00780 [Ruminococcaceae bacterium]|nr:hypothetical protein [Oscillospiraceae bacterium]